MALRYEASKEKPIIRRHGDTIYIPFVLPTMSDEAVGDLVQDLDGAGWSDQAEALASMHWLGEDSRTVG